MRGATFSGILVLLLMVVVDEVEPRRNTKSLLIELRNSVNNIYSDSETGISNNNPHVHSRVKRGADAATSTADPTVNPHADPLGPDNLWGGTLRGTDNTPEFHTRGIPAILTFSIFVGSIVGIIFKQRYDEKVEKEKENRPSDEDEQIEGSWFKKISEKKKKKKSGLMGMIGRQPTLAVKAFSNLQKKRMAKYKLYEDMLATYAQSLRIQKANTLKKQRLESMKSMTAPPSVGGEEETKADKAERLKQLALAHSVSHAPSALGLPVDLSHDRKVSTDSVFASDEMELTKRKKSSVGFADNVSDTSRPSGGVSLSIHVVDEAEAEAEEPVDLHALSAGGRAHVQISMKPQIKKVEVPDIKVEANVPSLKVRAHIEEDQLMETVNVGVEESAPDLAWGDESPESPKDVVMSPEKPKVVSPERKKEVVVHTERPKDMVVSLDAKGSAHTVVSVDPHRDDKKKDEKKGGILSTVLGGRGSPVSKRKAKEVPSEKSVDELIQEEMVAAILSRLPDDEDEAEVKVSKKDGPVISEDEIEETIMSHEESGVDLEDPDDYFNKEEAKSAGEKETLLMSPIKSPVKSPAKSPVKAVKQQERPKSWFGLPRKHLQASPLASKEDLRKKKLIRPQSHVELSTQREDPVTELFAKLMDLPPASSKGSRGSLTGSKRSSLKCGSAVQQVMDHAIASAVAGEDFEARAMSADSALKPPLKKKRNEKDVERMLKEVEKRMIATIHDDIDFEDTEVDALEALLDGVSKYCSNYVENWTDTQARRAASFTEVNEELRASEEVRQRATSPLADEGDKDSRPQDGTKKRTSKGYSPRK